MKFLCPNCKAKYQISEEKIAGRTLKMDCRRCNHAIVIRGDKSGTPRKSRTSSTALDSGRASYAGPSPARSPSSRGSAPGPGATALDQWHVAINDVPIGPLRREEIKKKIATGDVTKESLAWREGLDDWRPIKNIPDLAPLLRRAGAPPPIKKKPPLPPPPARPLGRGPKAARPGRPPTGRQPTGRQPTGRQPTGPARREAKRPAARGNVVPIAGGRLGGAAAPVFEEHDYNENDDDPTRVGSQLDFEKAQAKLTEERARKARDREEEDKRERAAQAKRDAEARAEDAREAERAEARAKAAASAEPKPETKPEEEKEKAAAPVGLGEAGHIAHSDAFDPFASQSGNAHAPAVAEAAAPPEPAPAEPAPAAPAPAAPAPAALEAVPIEHRRRAIPIGAWIAIAGAASFGVVLAVMVGTFYLTPPPAPVAVAPVAPPAPDPPPERELAVDPTLVEEPVEDPAETNEEPTEEPSEEPTEAPEGTQGATEAPARGGSHSAGGSGTGRSGRSNPEETEEPTRRRRGAALDPAAQARLDRFAGTSSDHAPNLDVSRPSNTLPGQESRGETSPELTGEQISAVVRRERSGVQRCYETFARQSGQAPALRLDVDVTIGGSGTVTRATARGRSFGTVGECIERTVRRWRFPRTGSTSRVSIPFVFTGRE